MDPYEVLDLPKQFTLQELKDNYKRIAIKVHPDKGGSEQLFQLVTKCYKTLLAEYQRRNSGKEFYDLKAEFRKVMAAPQAPRTQAASSSFDLNTFNKIFQENRLENPMDKGYKDWMDHHEAPKTRPRGNVTEKNFHQQFERSTRLDKKNKYIIPYKEPEPLLMAKKVMFSELGQDNLDDFSGDNTSNKHLNFMDYRLAHTTSRIVDPSLAKNMRQYRNVQELEADRGNVRYQMNAEEEEDYKLQQRLAALKEEKRLEAMRLEEEAFSRHFDRVNRLTIGMRR